MKRYTENHTALRRLAVVLLLILGLAATGCDMLDVNVVEDDPAPMLSASPGEDEAKQIIGPPDEAPGEVDANTRYVNMNEAVVITLPPHVARVPSDDDKNTLGGKWINQAVIIGPPEEAPGDDGPFTSPPDEAPAEDLLGTWTFVEAQTTSGKKRWSPLVTFEADGRVRLETQCAIHEGVFSSTSQGQLTVSALELHHQLCNTLVEDPLVAALQAATSYKIVANQLFIACGDKELVFYNEPTF